MSTTNRPYIFYELTNSICSVCLRKVEAKVIIENDQVFLLKYCGKHLPVRRCSLRVTPHIIKNAAISSSRRRCRCIWNTPIQVRLPVRLRAVPGS